MRRTPVAFDDCIGPDGTVRLRSYLAHAGTSWLDAGCRGPQGCGRTVPIGIREAVRMMGSAEATAGGLERHLRCAACGGRGVRVRVAVGPRPAEVRRREGPLPVVQARSGGGSWCPEEEKSGTNEWRRRSSFATTREAAPGDSGAA